MLIALLEPTEMLKKDEAAGNLTARLALQEEIRGPAVRRRVGPLLRRSRACPSGAAWLDRVKEYERGVLAARK